MPEDRYTGNGLDPGLENLDDGLALRTLEMERWLPQTTQAMRKLRVPGRGDPDKYARLLQALAEKGELSGEEMLTLGYGSGDAAEVIPLTVSSDWREATAAMGFAKAMEFAIDLDMQQYQALHDGRRVRELTYLPKDEFVIDKVGRTDERQFQDIGIEYYRYVS